MAFNRRGFCLGLTACITGSQVLAATGFDGWLTGFQSRAIAAGISPRIVTSALANISHLPGVIKSDRKQAEVSRSLQDYLSSAASPTRLKGGQKALIQYKSLLRKIERSYGVEAEVVVAIWGMESNFGGFRGNTPVLSTLATLAYEGRRAKMFERELIAALKILQAGDTRLKHLHGSSAGAMGHTQFMPSTFLNHAVDFNRDGRRNIWSDDPSDALASTAAYLKAEGWKKSQPWAIEVRLPAGFDPGLTGRIHRRKPREWAKLGVTSASNSRPNRHGAGAIILPAGPSGPAFMIFNNFHVLKRYNYADSYVIAVGHLSDRLAGQGAIRSGFPKQPWNMTTDNRRRLQQRLNAKGFQAGRPDGVIGEKGRAAIRAYEAAQGLRQTGVPSASLLNTLR